jgi:ankyrin repeat protein
MRTLEQLYEQIGEVEDFRGTRVNSPDIVGVNAVRPLHVAASWGDCEAIMLLVDAGADINAQGECGFTPLMEAVVQGRVDAVRLLLSLGAKPIRNDNGLLPSEMAKLSNKQDILSLLKKNGL